MLKRAILNVVFLITIITSSTFLQGKDRTPCYPYITGDAFRAYADYIYDEDTCNIEIQKLKAHDVIFVKTELLDNFIKEFHAFIEHPYILITHNSDVDIPGNHRQFLEDSKLVAWFGQNVIDYVHPKLIPIPIGLTNRYNPLGDPKPITLAIAATKKKKSPRSTTAYLNVNLHTNLQARLKVYEYFYGKPFCKIITDTIPFPSYLRNVMHAKYVVSPRGNGLDCHRTWEALYLGAIPIVQASAMDPIFEELPVLIVNAWEDISESMLLEEVFENSQKTF